jgi:MFS family permease
VGAGLFLFAGMVAMTLPYRPPEKSKDRVNPLRNIAEGVSYIRRDSIIITVLFITIVMNMCAFPYQAMVPVITEETLKVSDTMFGLLVSVEGLGATMGALLVASRASPSYYSRIYFWGSILFLCVILTFSRVPWYWLSMLLLFIGGFGMSGFGTMQSIMMLSATPAEMRGRVLGVLSVSIGTGPLAALYVGVIAEALGAPAAVLIISIIGLTLMAATAIVSPAFLKLRDVKPLAERNAARGASERPAVVS